MHSAPYDFADRDHVASVNLKLLDLNPESRMLDFGCGRGALACELARRGYRVTACDIDGRKLGQLPEPCGPYPIATVLLTAGAPTLPFRDREFDVIVCREVLEHIPDYARTLAELRRALKPGGILLVSVPARLSERLCHWFDEKWYEKSGHLRVFAKKALLAEFVASGWSVIRVENKQFFWAWNWLFLSMVKTRHTMGAIESNSALYNALLRGWRLLEILHLKRTVERIGDRVFPKSHFFYLKKRSVAP
ncbi:MAG: class I SAM-dependent methyltransferase [candidate division Zixibacteria bacterium]|nr:class I SAM-dependent methyltransferase [candidate division Zixibacteria bacterium]